MPITHRQQGTVLILTLSFFMVLLAIVGALVWTSHNHADVNRTFRSSLVAQYVALGALNIATGMLNDNPNVRRLEGQFVTDDATKQLASWDSIIYLEDGSTQWKRLSDNADIDGTGPTPADAMFNVKDLPLKQRSNRHFRVLIQPNGTTAYEAQSSAAYDRYGFGMRGFMNRDSSGQGLPGVTGYKRIYIKESSVVDSYNSQTGPYGAGNMNEEGDVGSNGDITIDGDMVAPQAMVYGDVNPGPDGTVTGPEQVAPGHSTDPRTDLLPVPSELDTDWLTVATSGDFRLNPGNTQDVAAGTYHYDSVDWKGTVNINGDVTIYCHGDFTANSSGTLNINTGGKLTLYVHGTFGYNGTFNSVNQDPADFVIKLTRDDRDLEGDPLTGDNYPVHINGASAIYAIIDAPWANVQVTGGSDFYGSIVAYDLLLGGNGDGPEPHEAKIHYDENLSNMQTISYSYFLHSNTKGAFEDLPVWHTYPIPADEYRQ